MASQPGPTLADSSNPQRRIRKLQASRDNLLAQIEEKQESIIIMDHEIAELQAAVGSDIGDKVQFIQDLTEKHGRY